MRNEGKGHGGQGLVKERERERERVDFEKMGILFWLEFLDWCIVWLCLVAKKVQEYTRKLKKLRI